MKGMAKNPKARREPLIPAESEGMTMKLTDAEAIKALKKVRITELEEMIDDYPENERDCRSDWEMIANEAGWLLDSFNSYDTVLREDLDEAKDILSKTHYGKTPYLTYSGHVYKEHEIQTAKNIVNEYNRLTRFVARLKGMGLYCPYC